MLFLRPVFMVGLISSSKFWWGLPKKWGSSWIEIFWPAWTKRGHLIFSRGAWHSGGHYGKEGKKYQHLSISSFSNTHFQHPFYLRTWQLFYLSFLAYDKQQSAIRRDQYQLPGKDIVWSFLGLSMRLSKACLRSPSISSLNTVPIYDVFFQALRVCYL